MSCAARLSVVQLQWSLDTSCTILLNRGTITSWIVDKNEKIFMEMMPDLKPPKPLLGGIRLSFPQHGPWPFGPENGFASTQLWTLTTPPHRNAMGDVEATLTLTDNCVTRSMWYNNFIINNTVTLKEYSISVRLEVKNTTSLSLRCQVYLVAHLTIDDVHVDIGGQEAKIDMDKFTLYREGLPDITVENLLDEKLGGYLQICCGTTQSIDVSDTSRHMLVLTWKEE